MEDKQAICTTLVEVLRLTRYGTNVDRIHYEKVGNGLELATIVQKYHGAAETQTRVDVTAENGFGMIRSILSTLE